MGPGARTHELNPIHDRRVVLENDHITLWYYPELGIVHHQMVATPTSDEFRELLVRGAETLEGVTARSNGCRMIRGTPSSGPTTRRGPTPEWLPRVLRAGFEFPGHRPPRGGDRKTQHATPREPAREPWHREPYRIDASTRVRVAPGRSRRGSLGHTLVPAGQ